MIGLPSTCSLINFIASSAPSTSLRFGAKSECVSDENDNRCCCANDVVYNPVVVVVIMVDNPPVFPVVGIIIIHDALFVALPPTKILRRIHVEI